MLKLFSKRDENHLGWRKHLLNQQSFAGNRKSFNHFREKHRVVKLVFIVAIRQE